MSHRRFLHTDLKSGLKNLIREGVRAVRSSEVGTRFGPNRVAADIQGNGGDDFLVKTGLRLRIKLRLRMIMAKTA